MVDLLGLFGDPSGWLRVAASTVLVYLFLVAMLRWTGNRTLAAMRAYDFVLVVAMGTLVSSAALTQVPLGNAVIAIVLLIGLQVGVASLARRFPRFERAITSAPILVVHRGQFVEEGLAKARLTREEVLLTLRSQGYHEIGKAGAVVLETNGDLSVLPQEGMDERRGEGTLANVR